MEDGKGVFIYSSNYGTYNIPPAQVSIRVSVGLSGFTEIKLFGIEMVHIPEGEFYLGDGVSISSLADNNGNPKLISSENAINSTELSIVNPNTLFAPEPLPASIPSHYPKGFESFYVMKYEISQMQYVDFLNTLTYTQQQARTAFSPSSTVGKNVMVNPNQPDSLYRNGIIIVSAGMPSSLPAIYGMDGDRNGIFNEDNDGHHRAANFLSWGDLCAYLDWAALRPMTEMEFEKICRGAANQPIAGEFAWGTALVTNANNPINDGTVYESVSDSLASGSGLANHGNIVALEGWGLRGALRTGFASSSNTNRLEAGASFYGAMEISGNVWEQAIMLSSEGIQFVGNYGDGLIDEEGNANQSSWCNPNTAFGVLLKGGGWQSTISEVGSWRDLAVSDRFYSHLKPNNRRSTVGGRGAR